MRQGRERGYCCELQSQMGQRHILVVEDDASSRQALVRVLRRRGHSVTPASSAQEAIQLADHKLFELAIVDIGLPDSDGWKLLNELQRRVPDLKAIALTGYGFPADRKKSATAGFVAHLTKPVQIIELENVIARLFGQKA